MNMTAPWLASAAPTAASAASVRSDIGRGALFRPIVEYSPFGSRAIVQRRQVAVLLCQLLEERGSGGAGPSSTRDGSTATTLFVIRAEHCAVARTRGS